MKRTVIGIAVFGLLFSARSALADWTPVKRLTWTSGYSFAPVVAVDPSDAIHVVWFDSTPGNYALYYKRSTDGGANWSALKRLTWNSSDAFGPALAVASSGDLHLVWEDETAGVEEIFYRKSIDGGGELGHGQKAHLDFRILQGAQPGYGFHRRYPRCLEGRNARQCGDLL
jgi:hypothetical protein